MRFWPKQGVFSKRVESAKLEKTAAMNEFEAVSTQEDFIEIIDFDTLNTIFDELDAKADVTEWQLDNRHRVTRDDISFYKAGPDKDGLTIDGTANVGEGTIKLNWHDRSESNQLTKNVLLVKTLIHEVTHIRGGSHHEWVSNNIDNQNTVLTTGLRNDFPVPESNWITVGFSLNEAITETIALDVNLEYLKRTGNTSLARESIAPDNAKGSYFTDRLCLMLVIGALSESLELPKEVIWQGFLRGYLQSDVRVTALIKELQSVLEDNKRIAEIVVLLSSERELYISGISNNALYDLLETQKQKEEVYADVVHGFDNARLHKIFNAE